MNAYHNVLKDSNRDMRLPLVNASKENIQKWSGKMLMVSGKVPSKDVNVMDT